MLNTEEVPMNYTKIYVTIAGQGSLLISEDELLVFKMAGEYERIAYKNNKNDPHRTDGPAFEWSNGRKSWWMNGQRHRLDGPAVIACDGTTEWWAYYIYYTKEEFEKEFK